MTDEELATLKDFSRRIWAKQRAATDPAMEGLYSILHSNVLRLIKGDRRPEFVAAVQKRLALLEQRS